MARSAMLALLCVALPLGCSSAGAALDARLADASADAPRDGGDLSVGQDGAALDQADLDTDDLDSSGADALAVDAGRDGAVDVAPMDLGGDTTPSTHFVIVTFNTGTTPGLPHDQPPADGYTSAEATISDQHYGDGLAWTKAVAATTAFFAQVKADVVAFQEIFYSGDCATIPAVAHKPFVCQSWKVGDPTVAQVVLGVGGWQVACHPGKADKCIAVRKSFGALRGCSADFCLQGLTGFKVKDCGGGARVARGVIDLVGGGTLTVVNVHGSSGVSKDDEKCREKQFEQAFVNLGDGQPGASGTHNIVLGDLNTDPGRLSWLDDSAKRFDQLVKQGGFSYISPLGPLAPPTYAGLLNIDHLVSDKLTGSCWAAGVGGKPVVTSAVYFDHVPLVCTVSRP
jgi:hypothetical protein